MLSISPLLLVSALVSVNQAPSDAEWASELIQAVSVAHAKGAQHPKSTSVAVTYSVYGARLSNTDAASAAQYCNGESFPGLAPLSAEDFLGLEARDSRGVTIHHSLGDAIFQVELDSDFRYQYHQIRYPEREHQVWFFPLSPDQEVVAQVLAYPADSDSRRWWSGLGNETLRDTLSGLAGHVLASHGTLVVDRETNSLTLRIEADASSNGRSVGSLLFSPLFRRIGGFVEIRLLHRDEGGSRLEFQEFDLNSKLIRSRTFEGIGDGYALRSERRVDYVPGASRELTVTSRTLSSISPAVADGIVDDIPERSGLVSDFRHDGTIYQYEWTGVVPQASELLEGGSDQ